MLHEQMVILGKKIAVSRHQVISISNFYEKAIDLSNEISYIEPNLINLNIRI